MDFGCGFTFHLQCPFSTDAASEASPTLMVSLMTISWDLGSADRVLMGGSRALLNHDVAGMQLNTYFWELSFWLLHALTLREVTVFLFLVFLLPFPSAFSVIVSMVASLVQFPSIMPIQDVEHPATRA